MLTFRARVIAMTLALALPLQQAVALPFLCRKAAPRSTPAPVAMRPLSPAERELARGIPIRSSWLVPVMFVPIAIAPTNAQPGAPALDEQRGTIADQLIQLGYDATIARDMVAQLTADDLAVLLDNPKMMQKAGEMDELTKNIIWALVIAGIVVAVVVAADGSINLN